ncbi:hydro-lyase, Fe-S type, tartrate/fumarate subfamily, beta subunit [Desulforamulus reducens MI-1]|uniref:Hydro-lyase, Fe-S type, tartrate/fumarate subfamily, beta subunit n=1 Tax=Desulforamulus reducens (strain ATCC BAA-1160 / DSM 100696 / MI-1) TaxID=349161 RepID=A4J5P2_DESRM|nr:Fe-S-containing hydro-lyase [Desulforamulus reducens]ABO50395.1 hydro-lyase, Fe-S type, tartrate/fumarate subfamily, beta subunit [Desulforamulus reducens MI-1]
MTKVHISTPLVEDVVKSLCIGQQVLISGVIYTGRDAAHKRLVQLMDEGKELPFDLKGQIIYYVGPSPAPPGRVIGSAGPTTAGRMDAYAPRLIERGLKGMIGKGARTENVTNAMKKHGAVYFAAIGGAAALISRSVQEAEIVAYSDLGPEAIYRLVVKDFPAIVVNDAFGGDLYQEGRKIYAIE